MRLSEGDCVRCFRKSVSFCKPAKTGKSDRGADHYAKFGFCERHGPEHELETGHVVTAK